MTDDDLRRYFRWIDRLTWRLMALLVAAWAIAMLTVAWWPWGRCP